MSRKIISLVATTVIILLSAYWLKNILGVNIFSEFSLSRYPVFSALNSEVIYSQPFPGIVAADSFDKDNLLVALRNQWKFYGATAEVAAEKTNSSSYRMVISAKTRERWNGSFVRYVQVSKGEQYQYSIRVKLIDSDSYARASIVTYDANREALSWSNFKTKAVKHNEWVDLRQNFTIPKGVHYIKFRITGAGIGEYVFDNFVLKKLPASTMQ